MDLSVIKYPPGYEPPPARSESQILQDLDRRCGYTQGEARTLDPSLASPPPDGKDQKVSASIVNIPRKMRNGLPGGCGRNSKAKAVGK
jgi:hypothetical protein